MARKFSFNCAHLVPKHEYSYRLQVAISAPGGTSETMIIDFTNLNQDVTIEIVDQFLVLGKKLKQQLPPLEKRSFSQPVSRRQNLLNLFEQGPETWFTVLELQNLAGLTSYTTRKVLKELVEENSIETRSQKSNRISWEEYKLKDQN